MELLVEFAIAYKKIRIKKSHDAQRPRLCEGLEFEIRPPGGNADKK